MGHVVTVTELWIYPIKSCRGIPVKTVSITPRGLDGDRRLMVVQPDGKMMTQRQLPQMATISATPAWRNGDAVILEHDYMPTTCFPIELKSLIAVTVHKVETQGWDLGDGPAKWLSQVMESECRLVYMSDDIHRQVDLRYAHEGDIVSFADAYPILLTTETSLRYLNTKLAHPVGMDRFRPNIVVEGLELVPLEEDQWKSLYIVGGHGIRTYFNIVKPCVRCIVTTTDQETGERDPMHEPFDTLVRIHNLGKGPVFGMNVIPETPGATRIIEVGDEFEVVYELNPNRGKG